MYMKPKGFEWDSGNQEKNRTKHDVTEKECEEVFGDQLLRIGNDSKHSAIEERFSALGQTQRGRRLVVFFTYRKKMIRIISARDQSKKERSQYEEK